MQEREDFGEINLRDEQLLRWPEAAERKPRVGYMFQESKTKPNVGVS